MTIKSERSRTILIEALSARGGGGRTYLQELFRRYQPVGQERVVAIVPKESKEDFEVNEQIEILAPPVKSRQVIFRWAWQRLAMGGLRRRIGATCVFCPGGMISVSTSMSYRVVTTCQNMLPFDATERARYPLGYMRARLLLLRYLQLWAFRRADKIIFLSEYAKKKVGLLLDEAAGRRSVVIPHGITDRSSGSIERPSQLEGLGKYVLYVSIIDVYKAQLEVVRAWSLLRSHRSTPEKLVLVGPEYKPYAKRLRREIANLCLEDEVVLLGEIPRNDLPQFYRHAEINLFASSCENGPIILLEAMSAGRPVLCSNVPPMPEFAGNAVLYFDPYNPKELAVLLASTLEDEKTRSSYGEMAAKRSEVFDIEDSTKRTWTLLRTLADQNP